MLRLIVFIALSFFTVSCYARFSDTVHYYLRYFSTGTINRTNDASSYVLINSLNFNTKKKNVVINTSASWVYGELQNTLTNNDFTAHGDIDLYRGTHKLYGWALITGDKSYSLKINSRIQAGAGVAYNFIDSPYLRINVSDGFFTRRVILLMQNWAAIFTRCHVIHFV